MKGLKKVAAIYSNRGFTLKHALMDGQFEPLHEDLMSLGINLNMMAANKHIPLIEQQIRVIKECIHATRHLLPFKAIPLLMLIKMVHTCVKWINAFPPKGGMSRTMSPRTIMTGTHPNYKSDCRLAFGAYVQAHQEPSPSNSQEARTVGAICLGLSGNIQGSFKFLNLATGRKITCQRWTLLPIPQEVINCMNQLGKADGQPNILLFYDC